MTADCPVCLGDGAVEAVSERDLLRPDMTAFGVALMACTRCDGEGTDTTEATAGTAPSPRSAQPEDAA